MAVVVAKEGNPRRPTRKRDALFSATQLRGAIQVIAAELATVTAGQRSASFDLDPAHLLIWEMRIPRTARLTAMFTF